MTGALDLTSETPLGRVARVDTARIMIDVTDHETLTRVTVANLVAIQGATASQFLIGLVDGVVRAVVEELFAPEAPDEEPVLGETMRDQLRVVLVGTFWSNYGDRVNEFKRGADTFPQVDRECFLIEGATLQAFMSILADDVALESRLELGTFVADRDAAAIADGNRLFQRHAALVGSTGAGKSWAVALILERAAKLDHPNLIVFDMHGEYAPLADPASGIARGYRIAGPSDIAAPSADALFLPYWLLNHEEMVALLLDRSDDNAPNQAARFTHHAWELKQAQLQAEGQSDVSVTFTVDSPVPYRIDELLARLQRDNEEMVPGAGNNLKQGPLFGKLTRFIMRLRAKVEDRRYGFMFAPPDASLAYDWLPNLVKEVLSSPTDAPGIKVIDFSEVPSDILPIVAGVLARTLYDVQFWMAPANRTPLCFVCDEAHLYLPPREMSDAADRQALTAFERIAKEGRKYGVALCVVSQRPSDVNRTILSQCNNFIAMRLSNDRDQAVVRRLMPESLGPLTDVLSLLDIGEALVLGDALLLPTRIKFSRPGIVPASATREFWTEWGTRSPDADAIERGVDAFRRQVRS